MNTLRTNSPNCNCRKGVQSCPLRGECLSKSTIYRAEVISKTGPGNSEESAEYIEYIGLASNHISSFRVKKQQMSTSLTSGK